MNRTVKVNLPENVTQDELILFEPYTSYSQGELTVQYLHDVFVTYTGFCVGDEGLIRECHHSYPEQYKTYLSEAHYYFKKGVADENEIIHLDNANTYLLVHHPWFNFYHWLNECIPRVWLVGSDTRDLVLLLPEEYRNVEWIMMSLAPFVFKEIFFIPHEKSLLIKNLCLPQIKPVCDCYYRDQLIEIRSLYLKYANRHYSAPTNSLKRVYLSRQKARRRFIVDELYLQELCGKYGIESLCNEDLNFFDQIRLYSGVEFLLSPNGSGLSHMLWMSEGSAIFELHKEKTNATDWHSFAFWYLASALDHKYYHQLCKPTDINASIFDANYLVDFDRLKTNFDLIFDV